MINLLIYLFRYLRDEWKVEWIIRKLRKRGKARRK